jgi:hypothetical protein
MITYDMSWRTTTTSHILIFKSEHTTLEHLDYEKGSLKQYLQHGNDMQAHTIIVIV